MYKLETEDLQVMEQDTIKVSMFLSTVGDQCMASVIPLVGIFYQMLPEVMSCCQWQQLLCHQDEVNSTREQEHVIWLMMQVSKHCILDTHHSYNDRSLRLVLIMVNVH